MIKLIIIRESYLFLEEKYNYLENIFKISLKDLLIK